MAERITINFPDETTARRVLDAALPKHDPAVRLTPNVVKNWLGVGVQFSQSDRAFAKALEQEKLKLQGYGFL